MDEGLKSCVHSSVYLVICFHDPTIIYSSIYWMDPTNDAIPGTLIAGLFERRLSMNPINRRFLVPGSRGGETDVRFLQLALPPFANSILIFVLWHAPSAWSVQYEVRLP